VADYALLDATIALTIRYPSLMIYRTRVVRDAAVHHGPLDVQVLQRVRIDAHRIVGQHLQVRQPPDFQAALLAFLEAQIGAGVGQR
jgi:hypothetical protein